MNSQTGYSMLHGASKKRQTNQLTNL